MASRDPLGEFVHAGLSAGQAPAQLAEALADAGWSAGEIANALSAWQRVPGLDLPVPRPRAYVSTRDTVIYGVLFIALANTIWATGTLGFAIIEVLVTDPGDFYPPPSGFMRLAMAQVIIFLPVFLWLNARVDRATCGDPGRRRSLVRKWLASVAMIVALLVFLGDAVTSVWALLNGDMTLRFALRAVVVAILSLLALGYLRGDVDAH